MPHHNLVEGYIDAFYRELVHSEIKQIILISPNHYDLGNHYVQSTTQIPTSLTLNEPLIEALEAQEVLGVESISLFGGENPLQNTSHLFVKIWTQ